MNPRMEYTVVSGRMLCSCAVQGHGLGCPCSQGKWPVSLECTGAPFTLRSNWDWFRQAVPWHSRSSSCFFISRPVASWQSVRPALVWDDGYEQGWAPQLPRILHRHVVPPRDKQRSRGDVATWASRLQTQPQKAWSNGPMALVLPYSTDSTAYLRTFVPFLCIVIITIIIVVVDLPHLPRACITETDDFNPDVPLVWWYTPSV